MDATNHGAGLKTLVYRTKFHPSGASTLPDFEILGDDVYRTAFHPDGASADPLYRVICGRWYRVAGHPEGACRFGDYDMADNVLCRTPYHRRGGSRLPDYEVRQMVIFGMAPGEVSVEVGLHDQSIDGQVCYGGTLAAVV